MKKQIQLGLALQGGGSHGAFTWGVLDRLLEEQVREGLVLDSISGTSAGALNSVLLADGLEQGGLQAARDKLKRYWQETGQQGILMGMLLRTPWDMLAGRYSLDQSLGFAALDIASRVLSPYDVQPVDLNPMRYVLRRHIDFDSVRACRALKLFINTTRVSTGTLRVFREHELTEDMLLASTCMPMAFQAVMIDDEPYWDGGYIANPALFPFVRETQVDDILIVQINPLKRKGTPRSARAIHDRISELTFNASLVKELRMLAMFNELLDKGEMRHGRAKPVRVHMIHGEDALAEFGSASQMNAEPGFLARLFEIGREAAARWLDTEAGNIGVRSSLDMSQWLEGVQDDSAFDLGRPERAA